MQFSSSTVRRTRSDRRVGAMSGCTRFRQRMPQREDIENTNCQIPQHCSSLNYAAHCKSSNSGPVKEPMRHASTDDDVIICEGLTRMGLRASTCGVYLAQTAQEHAGSPMGVFKPQSEEQIPDDFAHALGKGTLLYR
jgi:hypothetical protein